MKITHINTFDMEGGAARSAYRLHQGLLKIGENSQMLSRYKKSQDNQVYKILTNNNENREDLANFDYIQTHYINHNRTSLTNTLFSLVYPGYDLANLPIIENSDVINLHWVANQYQSPITIKNLLALGKPVIWTLHDMWAFTGGCHYSAGCQGYQTDCLNCPQLTEDIYNLPHLILQDKIANFNYPNLVIVTPSQWLANCVKNSQVFKHQRVEIISYSLDTDIFMPRVKSSAKISLNIPPDEIVLLVGAVSGKERRKGFLELIEVLKICQTNPQFTELIKENKIRICCFGESLDNFQELNIKVTALGIVNSDEKLSQIYASADVFILPSLEDNLPNTMLEAMSCGTAIIGFDIGGIPDLVKNNITGFVTSKNDLTAMANKIIELVFNPQLRQQISENCRQLMINNHALHIQADNYLNLYRELLENNFVNNLSDSQVQVRENQHELTTSLNFDCLSNFNSIKNQLITYSNFKELDNLQQIINYQKNDIKELYKIINNKDFHIENIDKLLHQNHDELVKKHQQIEEVYTQLHQTQQKLTQTQQELTQTQQELTQTQQELTQTQTKLNEANATIQGMESSKFWQLRNKWFVIKQKLGLKEHE